jgi:eukaryotic-like serine/threonine-protein kinase
LETFGEPGIHLDVTLSPNEQEVSFSRLEPHTGRFDIWRVDRASGVASRVTYGFKDQVGPVWSPDSSRIVYASTNLGFSSRNPDQLGEIYETPSAGGDHKLLLKSDNLKVPWSTNGHFLLYHEIHSGKKIDTWALSLQDGSTPIALLQGRSNQLFAVFSPDGKWVAYTSDESGKQEVYVTPFDPGAASASKWIVSNSGGSHPQWPGEGKQIYYLAPDKRIMAVSVSTTDGRFSCGVPHALFQSDIIDDFRAGFAVTSDGQRFLVPSAASQAGSPFATVIVNWTPGNQD